MNVKLFYVSSFGGSGTKWVSTCLNSHKNIVCFHGTRSIPPYTTGTYDITSEKFVEGLKIITTNTGKLFGAIHGFNGLALYDSIASVGGRFTAIHPILRINSLFHHYSKLANWDRGISNEANIYKCVQEQGLIQIKKVSNNETWLSPCCSRFQWICRGTIIFDLKLIQKLSKQSIFAV